MKNIKKTLHFNGKEISLVLADGQWWIALKPICEALGVDYIEQFKNLKEDLLLSQLLGEHTTVAADGKNRKMLCLPERYIYGWLFGIRSASPELLTYKLECYDVLFNHFHGRLSALVERLQIDERIAELETILADNEHYDEIMRKMDNDLLKGQIRLDFQTTAP